MSKVILVTGGARSGKSNFAEKLCKDQNNNTAYIATSIPFDDEMKERVKKHKESRPQNWKTYEIYKDIYTIINDISKEHKTVILDCVTLLVNNLMFTYEIDIDNSTQDEINEYKNSEKRKIEEIQGTIVMMVETQERYKKKLLIMMILKKK
ncbi:bifunctional adenosylcobinamide kinase/adenosylcobinamide-phosphate guanylyltransferase, partial [Romboutsia ilealis]|uniref:bifunctional adenosylcobinamide kinase/adenosylcobinamide-phosphate guanylyltransferase n=1 Tax=Romboutsia ilealis TaxID=1115758 RepID=UPI002729AF59